MKKVLNDTAKDINEACLKLKKMVKDKEMYNAGLQLVQGKWYIGAIVKDDGNE